jgi:8-oxo-dGTP pyrophosphatase MutT (NUDIX family)
MGHSDQISAGRTRLQLAALPWRRGATGVLKVLLVTSRETQRWVIPKGWPMKGKTHEAAAALEAFEEAGVIGSIDEAPLGSYRYDKRLKSGRLQPVKVAVYPLQVRSVAQMYHELGERRRAWFAPPAAAERVAEPELAQLLRGFAP